MEVTLTMTAARNGREKTKVQITAINGQNMQEKMVPEILLGLVETCMENVRRTATKESPTGKTALRALEKFGYALEEEAPDDGMAGLLDEEEEVEEPASKGTGTSGTSGTSRRAKSS